MITQRRRDRIFTTRALKLVISSLGIAGVVIFFAFQLRSIRAPRLILETPDQDLRLAAGAIDVRGRTDPDADVSLNGRPLFIGSDGAFDERVLLVRGVNRIEVESRSRYGKVSAQARYIVVP